MVMIKKPMRIYYAHSKKFEFVAEGYFSHLKNIGKVSDGDWDLKKKPFEEFWIYKGLKERFLLGKNWQETSYFKIVKKSIENGENPWFCKNLNDFNIRLENLDRMYESIKENGFDTGKGLDHVDTYSYSKLVNKDHGMRAKLDLISVNVGRNGELIVLEGKHRISMSKILGLSRVPFYVREWHIKSFKENKNNHLIN